MFHLLFIVLFVLIIEQMKNYNKKINHKFLLLKLLNVKESFIIFII